LDAVANIDDGLEILLGRGTGGRRIARPCPIDEGKIAIFGGGVVLDNQS